MKVTSEGQAILENRKNINTNIHKNDRNKSTIIVSYILF